MVKLAFNVAHDPHKLLDELNVLPFLAPVARSDGWYEAVFILASDGETVYLDVPDDLTPEQVAEIERVVNAHNPS